MNVFNKTLFTAMLSVTLYLPVANAAIDGLGFNHAWIAEAPPTSKVMAGYVEVSNDSNHDIILKSAKSDQFGSIEFHETVYDNGMASMVQYETIRVRSKTSVSFHSGGKHLMLFNPVKRLHAGDKVSITFTTKNDSRQTVIFTVKKPKF